MNINPQKKKKTSNLGRTGTRVIKSHSLLTRGDVTPSSPIVWSQSPQILFTKQIYLFQFKKKANLFIYFMGNRINGCKYVCAVYVQIRATHKLHILKKKLAFFQAVKQALHRDFTTVYICSGCFNVLIQIKWRTFFFFFWDLEHPNFGARSTEKQDPQLSGYPCRKGRISLNTVEEISTMGKESFTHGTQISIDRDKQEQTKKKTKKKTLATNNVA